MKHSLLVLGFSMAFSTAALAQTPLERAKAALPAEAGRALEQTVASAHSRGLPADPLVDKALEGVAKHAPANLILDAVRRRLELLAQAHAALTAFGPASDADVTSVADALQRGLSVDLVKRVRAGARSGEPVALAVHTLADLLDRGVPVDVAFAVLSSWRAHGANADELRQIPAALDRLVKDGETPGAAGRAIAASASSGSVPTSPPGLNKQPQKTNPGKGRVTPPVPPGAGAPTKGRSGRKSGQ